MTLCNIHVFKGDSSLRCRRTRSFRETYNPGKKVLGDLPFLMCFCMEFAANRQCNTLS